MSGRRIFVLRDFADRSLPYVLADLQARPPDGVERVEAPGLDKRDAQQGEILRDVVQPALERCSHVVAYVDGPNANVGLEVGFALGRGRPVGLCTLRSEKPAWLDDSVLRGLLVQKAANYEGVLPLLRLADREWVSVPGSLTAGTDTLLLCPVASHGSSLQNMAFALAPAWRVLRTSPTNLSDLPELLNGVCRVVWVITAHGEGEDQRDGAANASHAVLAGFALGRGLVLEVLREDGARKVVDVELRARVFGDHAAFQEEVRELAAPPAGPGGADPLKVYRSWVARQHRELVAFAPDLRGALLAERCVELNVNAEAEEASARREGLKGVGERPLRSGTLREMLAPGPEGGATRWLIVGEPGAGKTTMARDLVRRLAEDENGPLPIYVALARFLEGDGDVIDFVQRDVAGALGVDEARRVVSALRAKLDAPQAVWILLDGLDEVPTKRVVEARKRIADGSVAHPLATLVVLTRPVALEERGGLPGFAVAAVRPLDATQQQDLLTRLVGAPVAQRLAAVIGGNARLQEMARNPFLLTLIALVGRAALAEQRAVPADRARLYGEAVDLLLKRGHGLEPRPVRAPITLRKVLARLSLRLHEEGAPAWKPEALLEHLRALRRTDAALNADVADAWGDNETLLSDLGANSGILGPHDGPREPWRYLHRSLREFLAAEALATVPDRDAKRIVKAWSQATRPVSGAQAAAERRRLAEQAESWGEVWALYAGLSPNPAEPLARLRKASPELAVRTLRTVEGLDAAARLAFLFDTDSGWDAEDLRLVAATFPDGEAASRALLARVTPEQPMERLAWIWHVLVDIGRPPGREEFFRACGRWPKDGVFPALAFVRIPAGTFRMGSPPQESDRFPYEGPQREVAVRSFEITAHVVTQREWQAFARPAGRGRGTSAVGASLPVTYVSWWEAGLYGAWIGARLPSEAEWEYACRAGTTTRFWSGDHEADLARVAWYAMNSGMGVHPAGEKLANPWGLYDMHGNVWEWCADDYHSDYKGAPTDGSAWIDSPRAAGRVLRGGGWPWLARYQRSACRYAGSPSDRRSEWGFRLGRAVTAG